MGEEEERGWNGLYTRTWSVCSGLRFAFRVYQVAVSYAAVIWCWLRSTIHHVYG
jgi:hypothetical protein